ncbi:MAG: glucose-6-phosphate isomerase family protein [Candidatus Heimdallarchaeaceae archaeon]
MDLRESLGLSVESDEVALIYDNNEISVKNLIAYKVKDVVSNLNQQDWEGKDEEEEVFRTYEGIRRVEDKELWDDIRFDVVIVQSGVLGDTFKSTMGYYRSLAENGYNYPEIYQIVDGYAEILLQQPGEKHEQVKDAVMFRAQKFDAIIVPPVYGISIINPSEKRTILARIRADEAKEITKEFEKTKGTCYTRKEEGKWAFNENYEEIPQLRLGEPQNKWKTVKRGIPIYASYVYRPKHFQILKEPDPAEFML